MLSIFLLLSHFVAVGFAPVLLFLTIPLHIIVSVMKGNRRASNKAVKELQQIKEALQKNGQFPVDQDATKGGIDFVSFWDIVLIIGGIVFFGALASTVAQWFK
jgi:hypothetical protein